MSNNTTRAVLVLAFLAFAAAGLIMGWQVGGPIAAFVMAVLVVLS